ncbi:glycosyltransferase family 4 protein [Motilimonas eburnea]|uniref:glycosyltransferase family 4 protein n=1 Tax=Motilimonas eburnea TaxID=1737488 RepID=UPI001E5A2A1E|nr:glycosyltransferase family 4 protein [Motilimonas eburnea]MCE2572041.1 glycosyltransferase family 4 protein [Motilimonas eburnea]
MKTSTPLVWVFDPIDFHGGSKVATAHLLSQLPRHYQIRVITSHAKHWQTLAQAKSNYQCMSLWQPKWLRSCEQGWRYFARHLFLALQLLWLRLLSGRPELCVAASGPGVDLALYLIAPLLKCPLVQCVHGPVATSNTIAKALQRCDLLFYLAATKASLIECLSLRMTEQQAEIFLAQEHCHLMQNGLSSHFWPRANHDDAKGVLWAASLLKWKGLSLLLNAAKQLPTPIPFTVCYIRPQSSQLEVEQAPVNLPYFQWHENPAELDEIRAQHRIFVSTSQQEPFGLSILEAMAAGLCPVIPDDGAWWHQELRHGQNCIVYQANNPEDLAKQLHYLERHPDKQIEIGQAAQQVAQQYRAEVCYRPLLMKMLRAMVWQHLIGGRYAAH